MIKYLQLARIEKDVVSLSRQFLEARQQQLARSGELSGFEEWMELEDKCQELLCEINVRLESFGELLSSISAEQASSFTPSNQSNMQISYYKHEDSHQKELVLLRGGLRVTLIRRHNGISLTQVCLSDTIPDDYQEHGYQPVQEDEFWALYKEYNLQLCVKNWYELLFDQMTHSKGFLI